MTNRQAAALETRKRLLSAAKTLICEKGLTGTSVEEITAACGVSKGTFYTYFKRKEDIVLELSQSMFGEILSEAEQQSGGILKQLTYYMVHFSDYIEKGTVRMAQSWICNVSDPSVTQEGADKLRMDHLALEVLVSEGIVSGQLRANAPVWELACGLCEILYGQLWCWVLSNGAYSLKERTEDYCTHLLPDYLRPYII